MIIFNLSKEHVVFVDDLNSAGKLEEIKIWWVTQLTEGPKYGYYPKSLKSFFVIKQNYKEYARRKSGESNIKTTTEGTGHLVTVLGAVSFKEGYIRNKVLSWKNQLQVLSKIAEIKPQAAYSLYIYIFELKHKFTFFLRTVPEIAGCLLPIEETLKSRFIPAITGDYICSHAEIALLSLPVKFGGL